LGRDFLHSSLLLNDLLLLNVHRKTECSLPDWNRKEVTTTKKENESLRGQLHRSEEALRFEQSKNEIKRFQNCNFVRKQTKEESPECVEENIFATNKYLKHQLSEMEKANLLLISDHNRIINEILILSERYKLTKKENGLIKSYLRETKHTIESRRSTKDSLKLLMTEKAKDDSTIVVLHSPISQLNVSVKSLETEKHKMNKRIDTLVQQISSHNLEMPALNMVEERRHCAALTTSLKATKDLLNEEIKKNLKLTARLNRIRRSDNVDFYFLQLSDQLKEMRRKMKFLRETIRNATKTIFAKARDE
jgi:hypothetical protein